MTRKYLVLAAALHISGAAAGAKKGPSAPIATTGPATVTCPDGFISELDHCVRYLTQPLVPICPEGILQPDNICLVIAAPLRVCPPDFMLSGPTCLRSSTAAAALTCPPGFLFEPGYKKMASICTRTIETPPQIVCPPNSSPHANGCVIETSVLPAVTCMEGSVLTGNVCLRSEIYECAPAFGQKHAKKSKRLLEAVPFQNSAGIDYDLAEQRMLGLKKFEVLPEEIVEIAIVGQQCERRTALPPVLTCPPGAILVGRECLVSQVVGTIMGPPGVSVETAPPLATCPPTFAPCGGYKMSKKHPHECCSSEEAPFAFTCPAGFALSEDVCQSLRQAEHVCASANFHKHKQRDECARAEYVEPIITFTSQITCVGAECGDVKHKKLK